MRTTILIMAGGRGERFWPKSRKNYPKQFLNLTDDNKTMIQLTVDRISSLVDREDIFIVTNKDYKALVRQQLPDIPEENILCEPVGRNTAPCIGLGAVHIQKKYKDALMVVLPSDHLVKFPNLFLATVQDACRIAEKRSNLVTIGIAPDYPETGYGYIKFRQDKPEGRAYQVERFVEKPTLKMAKEYLDSEEYLWNSGMFVWKISSILENISRCMPDTYSRLMRIQDAIEDENYELILEREFHGMESQSIDYGVMEKAKDIYILPGSFGWDDVGSWLAVGRIKKSDELGNVVSGNVITVGSRECVIQAGNKLIAAVGLEDTVVVDTEDATLICAKDHAGDIKKVLENLKICNRKQYI